MILGLVMLGAGCANFPEVAAVEGPEVDNSPYPRLAPIDSLLTDEAPLIPEDLEGSLTGRAEALQTRAERLRQQPVIDAGNRTRMEDGVAQTP